MAELKPAAEVQHRQEAARGSTTCEVVAELKPAIMIMLLLFYRSSTTCEVVAELKREIGLHCHRCYSSSTTCEVVAELKLALLLVPTIVLSAFHDLRGRGRIEA